jgi:hypothetical protein
MTTRIAIVLRHPDPTEGHLLHALADVYAEGAVAGGHDVRRIDVANLDIPLLRTQLRFETGAMPTGLVQARDGPAMTCAEPSTGCRKRPRFPEAATLTERERTATQPFFLSNCTLHAFAIVAQLNSSHRIRVAEPMVLFESLSREAPAAFPVGFRHLS